ncbi:MAG: thiamine phosphate synthase [Lachnospiraceae bacterium]
MYEDEQLFKYVVAVSNRHLCKIPLEKQIERICVYHPQAVVLREKDLSEAEYAVLAERVITICNEYNVPCILHSFVEVAKILNHSFIHLPLPLLKEYHEGLTSFSKIGTSVHSLEEAYTAKWYGADYIVAGHVYETSCKKGVEPKGVEFLSEICKNVDIPVYAIGGIGLNKSQILELLEAGARGGFVMSSFMTL